MPNLSTDAGTTKYCLYQVLIEAERKIAEDEDLSVEIDYAYFQKSNLAFIPNMFADALAEYESNTGSIEIDEKLNHLGERDEDDWDCSKKRKSELGWTLTSKFWCGCIGKACR